MAVKRAYRRDHLAVCFACGKRAAYMVRRWVGHPQGMWDGLARCCAAHQLPARWTMADELRFVTRAKRVPVRDAERLRRQRLVAIAAWNFRDWRS